MQDDVITDSIFEAAMRLHESLDAGEIVKLAIEILSDKVASETWAVFLKAVQVDRLELVRAVNAEALAVGSFVELQDTSSKLAQAATEQKTITGGHGSTAATAHRNGIVELCVPLVARRKLLGAVQATRKLGATNPTFQPDEVRAAEAICSSLAVALANANEYHEATRQTLIDDLTRLYNVRYLYQMLDNEIRRARRYGSAVSVVFMDLDGFKLVNDAYGHRAGSATLTEVADVIAGSVRDTDFIARYGGDEFVIMLPETPSIPGVQMAERVRTRIAAHSFNGGVGADIYLTASFGVASFPEHATEAERLIELADAAMYDAKQNKKNSVRLAALNV